MASEKIIVRCPVFMRYNHTAKRYTKCGEKVEAAWLTQHMRNEHSIESRDMLEFYEAHANDPNWEPSR